MRRTYEIREPQLTHMLFTRAAAALVIIELYKAGIEFTVNEVKG